MILVIDVGNTNITFGVYESKKLVTTFRMTSRTMRTSDEYGTEILAMLQNNQIDRRKVGGAIIASVVPKVMHALIGAVVRYLHTEPLIVGSGIKTGIKITSENPKEIGPDRIVDVVAAYEKYGGPVPVSYTHLEAEAQAKAAAEEAAQLEAEAQAKAAEEAARLEACLLYTSRCV